MLRREKARTEHTHNTPITRDKSLSWCKSSGDRFIPHRISANSTNYDMLPIRELLTPHEEADWQTQYGELLRASFSNLDSTTQNPKLFTYNINSRKSRKLSEPEPMQIKKNKPKRRSKFNLPKEPYKVLEAPELEDDFYLSLLDWSSNNMIAVSLGSTVYVYNVETGEMNKIYEAFDCEATTSLRWDRSGKRLAIGSLLGQVTIWDLEKDAEYDVVENHQERVGSIDWGCTMLVGSKDATISRVDLRQHSLANRYEGHEGEVCRVRWSPDESLFASGGNDNKLFIWSPKNKIPLMKEPHKATVKALDWSIRQYGVLASGGGAADKTLRVWNTSTREMTYSRETGSQICSLLFSKRSGDIISGHGYPGNEVCIWRAKGLKKVGSLTGHGERVLYTALSPCGENVVSASADETLRFWRLYGEEPVEGEREKEKEREKERGKSFISSSSLIR